VNSRIALTVAAVTDTRASKSTRQGTTNAWPILAMKVPTHLLVHLNRPALHPPAAIHPLENQELAAARVTSGRARISITRSATPTRRTARVRAARSGSPMAIYRILAFPSGRKRVQVIRTVVYGVTVLLTVRAIMMAPGSLQLILQTLLPQELHLNRPMNQRHPVQQVIPRRQFHRRPRLHALRMNPLLRLLMV
jgi:hypothetical protein